LPPEQQAAPCAQQLLECYRTVGLAPIDDGRAVPDLVAAWQRGDFSNDMLRIKIKEESSRNFARGIYKSRTEQTIIYELAAALADAYAVAQYTELLPTGIELLQKSADAGHMIMIVTNWDMASFDLVREKFAQELFKFVKPEHVLVSAQLCMLKPCPEIYMTALERARNAFDKPFVAYFVDNSPANVRMAERCGMKGIQHTFS
jgi:FMN phosphatase YigB (HAD superfamily)